MSAYLIFVVLVTVVPFAVGEWCKHQIRQSILQRLKAVDESKFGELISLRQRGLFAVNPFKFSRFVRQVLSSGFHDSKVEEQVALYHRWRRAAWVSFSLIMFTLASFVALAGLLKAGAFG